MKQHQHIGTRYELKAGQNLKAIVLPLLPEPKDCGRYWVWEGKPFGSFWFKSEGVGNRLLKRLPYQVGDHLYLDNCIEIPGLDWKDIDRLLENTDSSDYFQGWFVITDRKVIQMSDISIENTVSSGLSDISATETDRGDAIARLEQCQTNWNAAYPEQPWGRDRWVIVLQVEAQ